MWLVLGITVISGKPRLQNGIGQWPDFLGQDFYGTSDLTCQYFNGLLENAQLAQFSMRNPETRSNSRSLLVTTISPRLRAWPAII